MWHHSNAASVDCADAATGCVLVVDDDPVTQRQITRYFIEKDMPAKPVSNRHELGRLLYASCPSAIVLGPLPGQGDGLDLVREIRSSSDVPIILMSARRHDGVDGVIGLELGADDYIAKPPDLRELRARVRAVIRRHEMGRASRSREPAGGGYRFNGWQLQRRHRRLMDPRGNPVALTKGEYALLVAFLEAPQRPLTRERLLQVTRVHEDIFDRSIDVQIMRLRRKIEADAGAPRLLQTERGVGYVFAAPVEPL